MKQIKKLIHFHSIPKMELAEALGLSWYQFDKQIYQDEIEFSIDTSELFSLYLKDNHGIFIHEKLIQEYSRTSYEYTLEPHGVWDGRAYLETKKGYDFDPRTTIQDLLAGVGLPIINTLEDLGLIYTRVLRSHLLELKEIQLVVDLVEEQTGNKHHALDIVSRYVPLDKIEN